MPDKLFKLFVAAMLVGIAVLQIHTYRETKMAEKSVSERLDEMKAANVEMKKSVTNLQGDITKIVGQNTEQTVTIAELRSLLEAGGGMSTEVAAKFDEVQDEQESIQASLEGLASVVPDTVIEG